MSIVSPPPSSLSRALSTAGAVVVAFELTRRVVIGQLPLWVYLLSAVSMLCWVAIIVVPRRRMPLVRVAFVLMLVLGSAMAAATDGVEVAPVAVGLVALSRDPAVTLRVSACLTAIAVAIVLVSITVVPFTALGVLSMEAGIIVSFLAGQSRRQFVVAEQQRVRIREDEARASLLAERQHIAHDIHDVLAHSLGGLVIQLDAVDALLEAGETEAAAARVRASRTLAADGLSEARRAVAALRDGPRTAQVPLSAADLVAGFDDLFAAHRALDGRVEFVEHGRRSALDAALAAALRRTVQEGLTNARRHAPGEVVRVALDWGDHDVAVRIENHLGGGAVNRSGGGNGLVGMRARFAALPGGVASAAVEGGSFVVRVGGGTA